MSLPNKNKSSVRIHQHKVCAFVLVGIVVFCLVGAAEAELLTVTKAGTGNGTVVSTPAGIDCGSTCGASFGAGDGEAIPIWF